MKTTIYCKPTDKGIHSFYIIVDGEEYFLFHQKYRKGVHNYFSKGVGLEKAIDHSRSNYDSAINRTMDKFIMYIKYIEKEYKIVILNNRKSKNKSKKTIQVECA